MLFFRNRVVWRRLMLIVAPLLVVGTVIWQRQATVVSADRAVAEVNSGQGGPPPGISAEEWQAARVELEGITDSTFQCGGEEMPAYWRLLGWSVRQPECNGE